MLWYTSGRSVLNMMKKPFAGLAQSPKTGKMGLQGYTLFMLGGLLYFPHNSMKKRKELG